MKNIRSFERRQKGQMLPLLLVALVLGSLLMLPSIRYVGTHLKTTQVLEENVQGLYAADAGIESAFEWIMTEWTGQALGTSNYYWTNSLYENRMSVNVTVNAASGFLGEQFGGKSPNPPDQHSDWLSIKTAVNWTPAEPDSPGPYVYTFSMNLTNLIEDPDTTVHIGAVLVTIQDGTYYVDGSTNCTARYTDDPTQTGGGDSALLLVWGNPEKTKPLFEIVTSVIFSFQVFGPPPNPGFPSGIIFFDAVIPNRADMGTVIGNNEYSYFRITSTAWNEKGIQATVTSNVMSVNVFQSDNVTWVSKIIVMDWQIKP